MHTYIQAFDGPWHVAEKKELRGDKTGTVLHTYTVPICTKHTIGGAWGHRTWKHADAPRPICKRCLAAIAKAERIGD